MKITLYAYGRFNQTMGRLLRDFFEVQVYHHNQKGLDRVEADGFATVRTIEEACSADLVFLGVPIQKTRQTLLDLRPHLSNTTTIVEQCSVKELPLQWCQEVLWDDIPYMITHPMFGPDSANTGFSGLNYVLDTTESTAHPELLGFWATFLESQGMSVIDMTAEEHDREAAYTQGITHFLGRVLDHFDIAPSSIATQGYKSLVELKENTCNDTKELFHDLQCLNRFTDPMRRELEKSFLEVDQEIKSGCVIGS